MAGHEEEVRERSSRAADKEAAVDHLTYSSGLREEMVKHHKRDANRDFGICLMPHSNISRRGSEQERSSTS